MKKLSIRALSAIMTMVMLLGVMPTSIFSDTDDNDGSSLNEAITVAPGGQEGNEAEDYSDSGLSAWMHPSDVPAGAVIADRKWTYTLTTVTESTQSVLDGYICVDTYWSQNGSGSANWASFPEGFDESNEIYTSFAGEQPYSDSESQESKRVTSNVKAGYVYWHWMYATEADANDRIVKNMPGTDAETGYLYDRFGAFCSSVNYPEYSASGEDTLYWQTGRIENATSQGSYYWYRFEYYTCHYSDYVRMYRHEKSEQMESSEPVPESEGISNIQEWVRYYIDDYSENGLSHWTPYEEMPVGAEIRDNRWDYTYTEEVVCETLPPEIEGHTFKEVQTNYGEYGSWSDWSTTVASESDSRQVETRVVVERAAYSQYNYYYYKYWNSTAGAYYYTYSASYAQAHGGKKYTYQSTTALPYYKTYDGHKAYRAPNGLMYWLESSTSVPEKSRVEYRYRDRAVSTFYHYVNDQTGKTAVYELLAADSINNDFGSWSAWSKTKVTANDYREVETRTVTDAAAYTVYNYYYYKYWNSSAGAYYYTYSSNMGGTKHTCSSKTAYTYYKTYDGKKAYKPSTGASGCKNYLHWLASTTTVPAVTHVEYRYRSRMSSLRLVEERSSATEITESAYNSNIRRYVKYVINLDYLDGVYFDCTGLTYTVNDDYTVNVSGYLEGTDLSKLKIPAVVYFNGVPYKVVSVADGAFKNCETITSVELNNNLLSIGKSAFENCTSITSLVVPMGVVTIGERAFANCTALASVIVGNGVKSIEQGAFDGCSVLEKISLGRSVSSIGARAFADCYDLRWVFFSGGMPTIEADAFDRAKQYIYSDWSAWTNESINESESLEPAELSEDSAELVESESKTVNNATIYNYYRYEYVLDGETYHSATEQGTKFTSQSIEPYEELGEVDGALAYTGPDGYTWWLESSETVESVTLYRYRTRYETAVSHSNEICFYYNDEAAWLNIGGWKDGNYITTRYNGWEDYVQWFAYGCADVVYLDENGYDYQGNRYLCDIENAAATLIKYNAGESIALTDLIVPSKVLYMNTECSVTAIGQGAFGQSALENVIIGESVTSVGSAAFSGCASLKTVTFTGSVQNIGDRAFNGCTALEALYFAGGVPATVGFDAFKDVSADLLVVHSDTATDWSDSWQGFKVYSYRNTEYKKAGKYGVDEFGINYTVSDQEDRTAIVGKRVSTTSDSEVNASATGYSATGDITVADFVMIDKKVYMVVGLDRYAFFNSDLTSVTLGQFIGYGESDDAPGIWDDSFKQAEFLTAVNVSEKNERYASLDGVLYKKADLGGTMIKELLMLYPAAKTQTTFTVPADTVSINQYAFANQKYLTSVNLTNVSTVGDHAFYACSALTSVTAPMLSVIGNEAFKNCMLLSAINLQAVKEIGVEAFYGCHAMKTVALGAVEKIGSMAFSHCASLEKFTVSGSEAYYADSYGVLIGKGSGEETLIQYPAASSAKAYTVADSVAFIDAYAFANAKNLEAIVLGEELKSIAEHAFDGCIKIKKLHIGAKVASIGTRAFYGCESLEGFTVFENPYYMVDDSGVLYAYNFEIDEDGIKTLIVDEQGYVVPGMLIAYPSAMQASAYTVYKGVTEIASAAFAGNTHLRRVILPATLKTVYDEAFAQCKSLEEIYFKGEVPTVGQGILDGVEGLEIFYSPVYRDSWDIEKVPYELRKYPLTEYNAIEELPNKITHASAYGIVVIDSKGNVIKGAKVTFEGCTVVPANGMYIVGLGENGYDQEYAVTVTTNGYKGFDDRITPDAEIGLSYITLIKESTVSGISCNGADINTKSVSINKWLYSKSAGSRYKGSNISIVVRGNCDLDAGYIVSKYGIVQNGKMLAVKEFQPWNVNGLEELGDRTFSIPVSSLTAGGKLQVYMQVLSPDDTTEDIYADLNISVFYRAIPVYTKKVSTGSSTKPAPDVYVDPSDNEDGEITDYAPPVFDLGNPVSVKAKSGNKLIDSLSFSLGIKDIATSVEIEGDTVKIAIGESREKSDKETSKYYTKEKSKGFSLSGDVVLKHTAKGWTIVNSNVTAAVTIKGEGTAKFPMLGVITVRCQVEISVSGAMTITFDVKNDGKLSFNNATIGLSGKITASAAVGLDGGVASAYAGIKGTLSNDIGFTIFPKASFDSWTLTGTISLFAEAKLGVGWLSAKVEAEKELVKGTFIVYQDGKWQFTKARNLARNMVMATMLTESYSVASTDQAEALNGDAKLLKIDDQNALMFSLANVLGGTCTPTSSYDGYNFVKLVCTKGTLENGQWVWGEPVIVDDNGFSDISYNAYEYDGEVYVVYTQANEKINELHELEDVLAMSDVKIAVLKDGAFAAMNTSFGDGKISLDDTYDSDMIFALANGVPTVVWKKNTDNNMFGMSDMNYVDEENDAFYAYNTTANEIYSSRYEDGGWSAPSCVVTGLPMITGIDLDDTGRILFTVDADSNPFSEDELGQSVYDSKTYLVNAGDSASYEELEVYAENAHSGVKSVDHRFVYVSGTEIRWFADDTLLVDTGCSDLSEYDLLTNDQGEVTAVFFIQSVSVGTEDSGDALFGIFNNGDGFGAPVQLTEAQSDLFYRSVDVSKMAEDLSLVINTMKKDDDNGTVYGIQTGVYVAENDLVLNDVTFDGSVAKELVLDVTNNGILDLDSVYASVYAPDGSVILADYQIDVGLKAGEEKLITLPVEIEQYVKGAYTVKVVAAEESTIYDNSVALELAYTDLVVYSKQMVIDGKNELIVRVLNTGAFAAENAVLYVSKGVQNDESWETLDENYLYAMNVGALAAGESKYFRIHLDEDFYEEGNEGIVTLYAVDEAVTEKNTDNNFAHVSVVDLTRKGSIESEDRSENPYFTDDVAQYEVVKGMSDVALEYVSNGYTPIAIKGAEADDFRVEDGKLILSSAFIKGLGAGTHTLEVIFQKGDDTCLKPVYVSSFKGYHSVTWIVDGVTTEELLPAGSVPKFEGTVEKEAGDGVAYIFEGWDLGGDGVADLLPGEEMSKLYDDVVCTAIFEEVTLKDEVVSITVVELPNNSVYTEGEAFDQSGTVLEVTYQSGRVETVSSGFAVSGYVSEQTGDQTVTLSYKGQSTGLGIKVMQRGDVDKSGTMSITDVTVLLNMLAYLSSSEYVFSGDVDRDDTLSINDVTTLLNFLSR